MKRMIVVLGVLLCMGGVANGAQMGFSVSQKPSASGNEQRRGPGFGPPPEAYTACEGKKEGDTAQFVDPEGRTVSGICQMAENRLVLRPDRPRNNSGGRPGDHSPPPEAYAACKDKKAGDAAELIDPRGETVRGTCEEQDGKLVLRPERPRRGQGGQQHVSR